MTLAEKAIFWAVATVYFMLTSHFRESGSLKVLDNVAALICMVTAGAFYYLAEKDKREKR